MFISFGLFFFFFQIKPQSLFEGLWFVVLFPHAIWMQGLQIALSFICMTVLLSFSLVLALLFGHRNVLSPIQAISPSPPNPQPPCSFSLEHTLVHSLHTIGIDIRTVPLPLKASHWWWTAGPSLAPLVTPIPTPSVFVFFSVQGWWGVGPACQVN